jgi:single-strand DNA-binding protein
VNQITIYGHLGQNAELKYTKNGSAVLSFSVATEEVWHDDKGEKHKKTEWHKCVAWRKIAEALAPYAKKGAALLIIGHNETRKWEKDGHTNYTTEIVVKHVGTPIQVKKESGNRENGPESPENSGNDNTDFNF